MMRSVSPQACSAQGVKRSHTGRRRNEAARAAILSAALDLLVEARSASAVTVDALSARAGVGKQTIYRWWPTKGAVLAEAMMDLAARQVRDPDSGDVCRDVSQFLVAIFRNMRVPVMASSLRAVMTEAQSDAAAYAVVTQYTSQRRQALRDILVRGRDRGQVSADADLDLFVDQAFGLIWYRLLLKRGSFSSQNARALAAGLLKQAAR